jgi:hypothetical protein
MYDIVHPKIHHFPCCTLPWRPLNRSEVSAGEAAIAQLERDLAAAQAQLAAAQAKATASQEDATEKENIIKYVVPPSVLLRCCPVNGSTLWWQNAHAVPVGLLPPLRMTVV